MLTVINCSFVILYLFAEIFSWYISCQRLSHHSFLCFLLWATGSNLFKSIIRNVTFINVYTALNYQLILFEVQQGNLQEDEHILQLLCITILCAPSSVIILFSPSAGVNKSSTWPKCLRDWLQLLFFRITVFN